jgi:L-asparaginase / beta-aspartyl-peptidase
MLTTIPHRHGILKRSGAKCSNIARVTTPATHDPTLLVHGGAWAIPADAAAAHESGVRRALEAGYALLSLGGSALDAVQAAVTVLEDDPTFDAGRGSFLTSDGRVQLDALLMDGGRMKAGGVACVERLRNPIQAARLVLEKSQHVYFVGSGAEQFAAAHGMALIDNAELVMDRERERLAHAQARAVAGLGDETFSGPESIPRHILHDDKDRETAAHPADGEGTGIREQGSEKRGRDGEDSKPFEDPTKPLEDPTKWSHDTVGAVALDGRGNLAAATSTGGTLNKTPGRVGDSSLIGCGCYADNLAAAVSLTGWGEPIMKLVLGKWATDRVAAGTVPEIAAREAISYLFNRMGGHGGIILLGPDGRFGLAHNTPAMAWGLATPGGLQTGLSV